MGSIFGRIKTWIANEDVAASDLNAEFDNVLNNLVPDQLDDYSTNAAEMQLTTNPGEVGTESLATTLAGELERVRFSLDEIVGKDEWYESPSASIEELNKLITSTTNNIISGKSRADSSQLIALDPDGTAATVVLRGAGTSFVYKIEAISYTIDSDVTLSSLQVASGDGTSDVALVDDISLADGLLTKVTGEHRTILTIDTVGSEILALVGKRATFRINNGSTDEYFTAFVKSTTELSSCRRGYFFDDIDDPIERIVISDGDTITLMKATWIYATTAEGLIASYLEPIYAADTPTATAGQYWFDIVNDIWKLGNGASFDDADAILIGETVQDSSGCIGARTHNILVNYTGVDTPSIEYVDASRIRTSDDSITADVFGNIISIKHDFGRWDIDTDLDSGISEAASTTYYFYLTEAGKPVISDIVPYNRISDMLGFYHPWQTWRAIGAIFNNSGSDFAVATLLKYVSLPDNSITDRVLPDGSITTDKIADDAVTGDKIPDLEITTAKINDLAVTSGKLSAANIASGIITGVNGTNSTSYVDTGLTTTFTATSGRPIIITIEPVNELADFTTSAGTIGYIRLMGGAAVMLTSSTTGPAAGANAPGWSKMITPAGGAIIYKVVFRNDTGGAVATTFEEYRIIIVEL